ncbi:OLC1v1007266C1 [Oldenlandia corymbosa var. corymbosa]|uniref:tRNA (guanine-N(7)-)-methyltransferase non-catalytic subunit n=1 Tax=Oldenlandia corymbosa var. corymbosa TaxID=529605 RepID=A0AAV1DLZ8_OLDCO|nr:OLC1v1007266C1 [Oldenlandia corymbosa var. corymbosa]
MKWIQNCREGLPVKLSDDGHSDSIRAIRYAANGKLFVSAGDDKLVKIWATDSWRCVYNVASEKRVSAVAISNDGLFVCFADKFGVVYVVDTRAFTEETPTSIIKKGVPILSHYCSIITSLEFSPDGRFIITADRDSKIRVTVFPQNSLNGAHEIQSFCLGHTEFVSCLAFVCNQEYPQGFLVSGSGDSTVRLWDFSSGSLLDTCDVGAEAAFADRKEEEGLLPITDLCTVQDGSLVAVAIQSLTGIMLLGCDLSKRNLSVVKVVSIAEETYIPTSIGSASTAELLWMVMGASSLNISDIKSLVRIRVLSGFSKCNAASVETLVLEDKDTPGGEQMLQTLQGKLSVEKEAFSSAAEAVKNSMRNLLIKKQYSAERRDFRKRGRNDIKNKAK